MYFPDKIGRLRTIQYACVVGVVGAGMQTGARSLGVMLAGRANWWLRGRCYLCSMPYVR